MPLYDIISYSLFVTSTSTIFSSFLSLSSLAENSSNIIGWVSSFGNEFKSSTKSSYTFFSALILSLIYLWSTPKFLSNNYDAGYLIQNVDHLFFIIF